LKTEQPHRLRNSQPGASCTSVEIRDIVAKQQRADTPEQAIDFAHLLHVDLLAIDDR